MAYQILGISRLMNGVSGAAFVLAPHGESGGFRRGGGRLAHPLFSPALGSWTVLGPPARLRTAGPGGHQVRVLPKRSPASWSTARIVLALTRGSASRRS